MKHYFSNIVSAQFDITDFETLIGDLSHAIVLFPEAAGSFAEAGYFSATPKLAAKTVLALDAYWQGSDSFISMGPAKKINEASRFFGIIQTPYAAPVFSDIVQRLKRIDLSKNRKTLTLGAFKNLTTYEKMCLIHKIINILTIATYDDLIYILRSLFANRFSTEITKQLMAILAGSKYILQVNDYGHYRTNNIKAPLLITRIGFSGEESLISLELGELYSRSDQEFLDIIEELDDAA